MDTSETLKKLKEQAKLNSIKKLQSLFDNSDELDQVGKHLQKTDTKKVKIKISVF
jgi:hypothetical protein